MDPLTHGVAGALIAKAFFAAEKSSPAVPHQEPAARPASPGAVTLVTLGALFPDADVVFSIFSTSTVATLEYHRWITHSIVCLPIFALALAFGTARWREFRRDRQGAGGTRLGRSEGPRNENILRLALLFAVGIASHIFLDAITSWGTMLWSPLGNSRTNWDLVFIIDGTLTGLLLLPQALAWIYSGGNKRTQRSTVVWLGAAATAAVLQPVSTRVGAPFSLTELAAVLAVLALIVFGPGWGAWSARWNRRDWCRAGVWATAAYLVLCFGAQRLALARVGEFARREQLVPQRIGALPLPPSMLRWAGIIRTNAGVYQATFSLLERTLPQFEFVADRATPDSLETARSLREVQTYLWFARFPLVETREEAGQRVVVFTDRRFVQRWASAPAPFEYWVVLDPRGHVVRQGWAQMLLLQRASEKD